MLLAGEGRADISPPVGTVLAGFHYQPGKERAAAGIRQVPKARALILKVGDVSALILSLEVTSFPRAFADELRNRIETATGVPAANVRVCATHTHSMPTLFPFLQWGAVSDAFRELVLQRSVEAAVAAKLDLAEADCYLGTERVQGGNFNRTVKTWKSDDVFTAQSTDDDRWLDTLLQTLYFQRAENKPPILWYHFCAHPVCFNDTQAGPDWPGLVADRVHAVDDIEPGYLQGHIGDVNPGDGTPWSGDAQETAAAVAPAVHYAMEHGDLIMVDELKIVRGEVELPYDLERLAKDIDLYKQHPEQCDKGEWVDAGFAKAWYEQAITGGAPPKTYQAPISAMRLGTLVLFFHPAELYSFYGLKLRTTAPAPNVISVGYCDDFIGYLPDPKAYEAKEYAAVVVPKIMGKPPYTADCARRFTEQCQAFLKKLA